MECAVMFRIVEDECPPIPGRFSRPLASFLKECFHKDPAQRPSAEQLFEHEWLKNHWGLNKVSLARDSRLSMRLRIGEGLATAR